MPNERKKPTVSPKIRILEAVIAVLTTDKVDAATIAKIEEMKTVAARATPAGDVVMKNEAGEVVEVENFGHAKTPYGYTRICKEGAKIQNTTARELRKSKDDVTKNWLKGEISEVDAKAALQELEGQEHTVTRRADGVGYATKEDATASL